jgi:spheroidene monooxygenase
MTGTPIAIGRVSSAAPAFGALSRLEGVAPQADVPHAAASAPQAAAAPFDEEVARPSTQTCVLVLADIGREARLWGWLRLARGSAALRGLPGLRFAKLLGSGHDGGFGLRPSASRQGLFLAFDRADQAQQFVAEAALLRAYRDRARELLTLTLAAYSVRGRWSGTTLAVAAKAPADGPIAALTRASIRPPAAARFWRHAPPSQSGLADARGCLLAVGLGEAPLLRQATFSLWSNARSMEAYARSGAHLEAIRAAASHDFFSESMFVRFVPLAIRGTWKGRVYTDDCLATAA